MKGSADKKCTGGDRDCQKEMLAAQVRPDGSGLRRVFDSHGGLANHPKFSPKFTPEAGRIVFTSDYAGYSAEEIALPHQFQPYGDLYAINIDGTGLQRLTHGRCFLLLFKDFCCEQTHVDNNHSETLTTATDCQEQVKHSTC